MRPECEVAADAVWALFEARLLPKRADTVVRAAEVAGISVADLRAASARWEQGWRSRPDREVVVPPPPPPPAPPATRPPAPAPAPASHAHAHVCDTHTRMHDDDPEKLPPQPTDRTCTACRQILPASKFAGSDNACRYCRNARRRELRVEKAKLVNAARLVFQVSDADGLRPPLCCMKCGLGFHIGEWVEGTSALRHIECPPDGLHRRGRVPAGAEEPLPS